MKTRVRPVHAVNDKWRLEVQDPYYCDVGQWVEIDTSKSFFWINRKASRLAKKSLAVKTNEKEEFIDTLKNGKGTNK